MTSAPHSPNLGLNIEVGLIDTEGGAPRPTCSTLPGKASACPKANSANYKTSFNVGFKRQGLEKKREIAV